MEIHSGHVVQPPANHWCTNLLTDWLPSQHTFGRPVNQQLGASGPPLAFPRHFGAVHDGVAKAAARRTIPAQVGIALSGVAMFPIRQLAQGPVIPSSSPSIWGGSIPPAALPEIAFSTACFAVEASVALQGKACSAPDMDCGLAV